MTKKEIVYEIRSHSCLFSEHNTLRSAEMYLNEAIQDCKDNFDEEEAKTVKIYRVEKKYTAII